MLQNFSLVQIALAIFGIGFLIAFHELGHYAAARLLGMRVLRYSLGFGKKLIGFRHQDIEYQIGMLPLGGFVQIAGMSSMDEEAKDDPKSYLNQPRWKRWLVLAAGPAFNYIAAVALFFAFFIGWPSPIDQPSIELIEVVQGSAGAAAGLQRGEFITAINGAPIGEESSFRTAITASKGAPITMTVLNTAGAAPVSRDVVVTPAAVDGGYKVGVSPQTRWPAAGVLATLDAALGTTVTTSIGTLNALKGLVMREPGVDVGGPVAIVASMKDQIAHGLRFYVHILAVLSVSLGVFNLLPVPGLDGIKMLWLTLEGIARRDIKPKLQEVINVVGTLLLLVIMALISVRDGIRLFS